MALPFLGIAGITVILGLLVSQKDFITRAYDSAKASLYRIPQSIFQIIENPCNEPWSVFVRTAREPGENLVIALASFGLDDVIRGATRPKTGRGKPHLRRGGKSGRKSQGIPELGEIVGKNIPGATTLRGRGVSMAEGMLWQADNVIQRGAWYWFAVKLADDFTYEWASAIVQSERCQALEYGRFRALQTSDEVYNILTPGLHIPEDYANIIYNEPLATFETNGREGYIVSNINGQAIDSVGSPWEIVIELLVGTIIVDSVVHRFEVDDGDFFFITLGAQLSSKNTAVRIRWRTVNPNLGQAEFEMFEGSQHWGMLFPLQP